MEWAPTERPGDYDESLFEAVRENLEPQKTLGEALATTRKLLGCDLPEPLGSLLFANVITAMETFRSDTIINRVLGDGRLLQKYLDTERAFREEKLTVNDVLRMAEQIKDIARKQLLGMRWHRIDKVKPLYGAVLLIDLGDIGHIAKAVQVRYDIVHRNGRKSDGTMHEIEAADITNLIQQVEFLATRIDLALNGQPRVDPDDEDLPF